MMNRLRRSTFAMVLASALLLTTGSLVAAQEEPVRPAAPGPGGPFAGVFSGTISFEPLDAPTESCPLGVRTITTATGSSTEGPVSLHAEHCPTTGLPTVPLGEQTLTMSSGDQIKGVYFVDCEPIMPSEQAGEPIECVGRYQIVGGTGAYAEATGSAQQVAFVWFPGSMQTPSWPWISRIEGTLDH